MDETKLLSSPAEYEKQWYEIKALFMGVQNHLDFFTACKAMKQGWPACVVEEAQEPRFHLSLEDIRCDELYEMKHGDIRRVHGTNLIYVQIYYREQESSIADTVEFDCPPGTTEAEVMQVIRTAKQEMPIGTEEDRLSHMEDVLSRTAVALHASWSYVTIAGGIEVE